MDEAALNSQLCSLIERIESKTRQLHMLQKAAALQARRASPSQAGGQPASSQRTQHPHRVPSAPLFSDVEPAEEAVCRGLPYGPAGQMYM